MKKSLIVVSLALLILGMVGCDLNPLSWHSLNFYDRLAGEGNAGSSRTIKHRSDGHTIVMSRGEGGQVLTEDQATVLITQTEFTLTLNNVQLTAITNKSVDKLSDGYHVVQSFDLGKRARSRYVLKGITIFKDKGNATRTNIVDLTIE